MKISELLAALEEIAPLRFAEAWDNVGLIVGNPAGNTSHVLLTIDYTPAVRREAKSKGCDFVIAYHPPIFDAIKRVTAGGIAFDAIADGIAIYSPHTALDVADGGTNDCLADVVGLVDRAPLRPRTAKATEYKLVTFVPAESVNKVSETIFAAGAGRIGQYTSCGFRSEGTGTFFGQAGTNPTVGQPGRLEKAAEIRLETVVPIESVAPVIAALRRSHPYEELAFDLNQLAPAPDGKGMGRVGRLEPPVDRGSLFERIKKGLGIEHLLIAGPTEGDVRSTAVCAGSCGELLNDALGAGVDLFLTGEVRHHDALRAARAGMTVVCTLHSNSERLVLRHLKSRLELAAPGLAVSISEADRDPFVVV